jgi:hypothetical protein
MRPLKIGLILLAVSFTGFVAMTWWALEAGGVAVIETVSPNGTPRETHVWFVEPEGELWLEAGSPANPWFLDVQRDPVLKLRADGHVRRTLAHPSDSTVDRDRIRALLRQKYGLRDRWVGLFVDGSQSVAVRLAPATRSR